MIEVHLGCDEKIHVRIQPMQGEKIAPAAIAVALPSMRGAKGGRLLMPGVPPGSTDRSQLSGSVPNWSMKTRSIVCPLPIAPAGHGETIS